eukprot:3336582-Rhodomonas_salina.1
MYPGTLQILSRVCIPREQGTGYRGTRVHWYPGTRYPVPGYTPSQGLSQFLRNPARLGAGAYDTMYQEATGTIPLPVPWYPGARYPGTPGTRAPGTTTMMTLHSDGHPGWYPGTRVPGYRSILYLSRIPYRDVSLN